MRILKVTYEDSKTVVILKLCYLIPVTIIMYLPICLLTGILEYGHPFKGLGFFLKEKFLAKD